MTFLTCAITSESITLLGEPIANSGEGKVWRTNHGYLAKIYHSPTPERVQKLAVMISHPPTEPNFHLNHISFAWPKSSLKNPQGDCVGFLMPEINDAKELLDVYNPQLRKRKKLEVDWRFLHITAQNIASIIASLHANGYVLGDIKPQNILVNNRALPSIIDTDSFQIRNPKNGKIYRCPVGSPEYTPPELIDKDFSSIDQTEVHDRFRLAVIIYQLLFGGQTPFAGKWIGAGETPEMNELIRRGLWLHAPNSLLQPVERTIPLEIVHPEVQRCFLKCFNDGHQNPHLRPTAREWLEALKVASNELNLCESIDSHYYSQTYGKCYWCDRSTKVGVDIFPGFVRAKPSTVVESTSQYKAFAAMNILELIKQKGKIITVVGKVINTRYLAPSVFFINFGEMSNLVNGYSPFTIVIFSEGLENLSNSKNLTVTQLRNWIGSYIKITGTIEVHRKSVRTTPQMILKDPNQISLISESEANNLITGGTNTNTSSPAKQTQSQFSQSAAYIPQTQTVITQPSVTSTTNTSSSVQPTQSQVSQTNQSANSLSSNNYSKQGIFQSGVAQSTSSSATSLPAKTTTNNTNANNTPQQLSAKKSIQNYAQHIIGLVLASATIGSLIFFAVISLFFSSNNSNYAKNEQSELTQSELRAIANSKIKKYISGIGISLQVDETTKIPTVTNVLKRSPAEFRNIQVGDQILEINGISTSKMRAVDVANLIQDDNTNTLFLRLGHPGLRDTNTILFKKHFINPTLDQDYVKRCSAHFKLKEYSDALEDCNEAVKINPTNDEAYFLRGASYIMNGYKYQGMEDLRKAASLGNEKARRILKEHD